MTKRILQLTLILFLAATAPGSADPTAPAGTPGLKDLPQLDQMGQVASAGLQTLRQVIAGNPRANLGMGSLEAAQATLGRPYRQYKVRLDLLQSYDGRDPMSLMDKSIEVIYPVLVGPQVRASLTLVWAGSVWKVASMGGAITAGRFDTLRNNHAQQAGMDPGQLFMVRIPALSKRFAGYFDASSNLELVPEKEDLPAGLQKGSTVPAAQAFSRLVGKANSTPLRTYLAPGKRRAK